MLLETIDWIKVMDVVAKETGKTKKAIGREMGISGPLLAAFSGATARPEPRHSEGEHLLSLYSEATENKKPPVLKKSPHVRCPCCAVLRSRGEIMRMSYQKFRCTNCVDGVEKRNRGK